ncbi:MAG: hypothetical protein ACI8P3_000207 [Saprospiraceae bacterium]|jgi:hypothetical protein
MSINKLSASKVFDPESPAVKKDLAEINSWKIRLYLLQNLPTAFWWRLKVKSCSPYRTEIEVPFNWRTKNPFKSIYFAALAGAGELSTGLMAGLVIRNTASKISMLVTNVEVDFIKKANAATTFTCDEGIKIIEGIQKAIDTNQGVEVSLNSTGVKKDGEIVAKFRITWSFRVK